MILKCQNCDKEFEAAIFVGLCTDCVEEHAEDRERVHAMQHPAPGVCADGKFTDKKCPSSVFDPVSGQNVCPLCGSSEIEAGYGLGGGYGMGSYNFCAECNTFLDFCEDTDE